MCLFKNDSKTIQLKFGVPFFDVFDPRFSDFSVPVAVRGELVFHVKNYKKFLKKNGFDGVSWDSFNNMIKSSVVRYVKDFVANAPAKYGIPVVQLEKKVATVSDGIQDELTDRIKHDFKIEVYSVDITAIEIDKTSAGYRQLKEVTTDVEAEKVRAKADVEIDEMRERSRIELEDEEESMRIERDDKASFYKKLIPICWIVGIAIVAVASVFIVKMIL